MDDVEHSYKRLFFFKKVVDEIISLSYFLDEDDDEIDVEKRKEILSSLMDKEQESTTGILTWISESFPAVWKAFNKKITIKELTLPEKFIFNHFNWSYKVFQWWIKKEEPNDEFLHWYNKCWEKIAIQYGAYKLKKKKGEAQ